MPEFVNHPWVHPNTIEARDYQESILQTALKGNTLCVLPTGLGKTPIAALVAAERMKQAFDARKQKKEKTETQKPTGFVSADTISPSDDAKVLFLAPTRPLVNQHRTSFEKFLKIGPDELKAITGSLSPGERRQLYAKADVVFATPQTIRNDLKNRTLDLGDFCLLIVDEAHRAVGNYAYVFIAKTYLEQARSPRILALTASPGSSRQKIEAIRKALGIENVAIRSREDSDVSPYVQKLDKSWIEVDVSEPFRSIARLLEKCKQERIMKLMEWKIIFNPNISKRDIIRLQGELLKRKTGASFAALSVLAEVMKIDHAIILAETQTLYSFQQYVARLRQQKSRAITRLFSDTNWMTAVRAAEDLYGKGIENPKLAKLTEIVATSLTPMSHFIIFTQYRDTADSIMDELKKIEGTRPVLFIGQTKKAGKGLSQAEQMEILDRFKLGGYNILVATSIGEEGLDITETEAVIFYEPVPSEIRMIQRAGRTARTKPGKVMILMNMGTRDQAFYWSAHHKERKMRSVLERMQKKTLWSYDK